MKYLLMLLILALVISGLTGIDMSLAPGLSIKNLFLYLAFALLVARAVIQRNIQFELAGITFAFLLLFAYATVTWIVAGVILDYEGYNLLASGMLLKNKLLDYIFIFWVFFYGLTRAESKEVLRFLLVVFGFAHVLGVAYYFGLLDLPGLYNPYDDRLRGFIGEVNQYGTLIACFLPAMIAQVFVGRTVISRVFWTSISVVSLVALLLSGSRGATVGLLVGAFVMFAFYRDILPTKRIFVGSIAALAIGGAVVLIVALTTGGFLVDRFIGDSQVAGLNNMTSGRAEIWASLLRLMADSPITFITGYGWNAYFSLPFRLAPHNTFLHYWFELGLIGLATLSWLLWTCVQVMRRGVNVSSGDDRSLLIGASVGVTAAAVSAFFVELPAVWPYFWMLAGVGARMTFSVEQASPSNSVDQAPARDLVHVGPSRARDAFGWHR